MYARSLTARAAVSLTALALLVAGCGTGVPHDEARARYSNEDYSTPEKWREVAEKYYPPAYLDYFEDMDAHGRADAQGARKLKLSPEAVKGRNAWVLWAAGNEAWWTWLAQYGYGTIDLLRLIDHTNRSSRFARSGLLNEPGTREPTEEETEQAFGVKFARPITPDYLAKNPGAGKPHVEYRQGYEGKEWHPASTFHPNEAVTYERYPVYGYPTGVVGLRLFPNPEFKKSAAARKRWQDNLHLYYGDPSTEEVRRYLAHPSTIRPFRVGMSCGYCHIAPHPLNPPADIEQPEWGNLSNNVGNQFMRIREAFGNVARPNNYLYHVFDSQLPGAVDTSGYPSDNINNPNTINSFFGLSGRLARAKQNRKEVIGADSLAYLRKYVEPYDGNKVVSPTEVPRVLLDGSDSVGVHVALSRVYLNIGTHHQQWIRVNNPLLGFRKQDPFTLKDIAENSLYWHATLIRVKPLVAFFLAATDPMRLKDVQLSPRFPKEELAKHLGKGDGLPWHATYDDGRKVFARGCIACHSSVQPGDRKDLEDLITGVLKAKTAPLEAKLKAAQEDKKKDEQLVASVRAEIAAIELPADRTGLRLRPQDRERVARGDGKLPELYVRWAQEAVKLREFWEWKDKDGLTVYNFLSIDERIPVTVTQTNSARAAATNGRHGHMWEDFSSQTYKELDAVGKVRYRDPISGADKSYEPLNGGPGYYRVPTLISIWATAPFLHNNALGTFNNDPSVKGRLESFDDSINRLLWPEKRLVPAEQVVWDADQAEPVKVYGGWYKGRRKQDEKERKSEESKGLAAQRLADDGGWIWRTTEESWFMLGGYHIPSLVAGLTGWSPFWLCLLPWIPSILFVLLGVLLLCGTVGSIQDRLERVSLLAWLLGPLRWLAAIISLALVGVVIYLNIKHRATIALLDVITGEGIPYLRTQVWLLPVVFLLSAVSFVAMPRIPKQGFWRRVVQYFGFACLVGAVVLAMSFGRVLSGNGPDVKFGPIPEGVPVNLLANVDPDAPAEKRLKALEALQDFVLAYHNAPADKKPGRIEFEEIVAPALMDASKCPDFTTDRGHDYEFIRNLSDAEKQALIQLLKTF
jgi:hypothetical protein